MKKKILIVIGVIGLLLIISSANNPNKRKDIPKTQTSQETTVKDDDLTISKEKFEYYSDIFLKLSELQEQYEQTYTKFGVVDLDTANKIPEDEDFPQYGSITRKISTIYNNIPKVNLNPDMTSGEKFLVFQTANYCVSLISLTPSKNGLEGMDFLIESKTELENGLKQVKDFNKF
jgi:hypothetical protein